MKSVILLGIGQIVSMVGTGMTRFGMTIWVWQTTERATPVALTWFFAIAPGVIASPLAGALIDRWNRKKVLIASDLTAGLATLGLLLLHAAGSLQIWHFYLAGTVAGIAEAFQTPARIASVTMMVPKDQLSRANGIISISQFGSLVLSPALAGGLIHVIGFDGILVIDLLSFLFAVSLFFFIPIPQPPARAESRKKISLWRDTVEGIQFILARKPMLHVMYVFTAVNFLIGIFDGLLNPMVQARTGQDSRTLGLVLSGRGLGGVSGGLFMSVWRSRRQIYGVLLGTFGLSLGYLMVGLGKASVVMWIAGAFTSFFFIPVMNGCIMAIGQVKVPPDFQGRVFGTLRMVAQISYPLALGTVGPLADYVFEPAMREGGALAALVGGTFGTGPGSGMSLLMVPFGLLGCLICVFGYLTPTIRDVETVMPDHDAAASQ